MDFKDRYRPLKVSKLVEVSHFSSSLPESAMSAKVSELVKVSHFGIHLVRLTLVTPRTSPET